jgi:hypothetical protein
MSMRRLIVVALLVLAPLPARAARPRSFELALGEAVLWSGPHIDASAGERTFDYVLHVARDGYRLRIGIDHPQVGDVFGVSVDGPGSAGASFSVGPGIYSEERLFGDPAAGTWRIRVTAEDVTDSAFRMRAKLERRRPSLGTRKKDGLVLPNLQILPPHDASFLTPITNGTGDEDPTGVPGGSGCHQEEHAEDGAVRCLRFGFGVRNTGRGPMDLFYTGGTEPEDQDLYQRVYRADGTSFERLAGKAVFHKTHGHYHHSEAVALQLFSVADPEKGGLDAVTDKRSKGFAHRNELLRDWDRFYPTDLPLRGFGLRPGWADIYEWDRPGNYIDFGVNEDGFYVVRMWADPVDGILEMNDRDNVAYTFMKIEGDAVELNEAGRGRDPWDPCKIEVGFGGFPDPPRSRRPHRCPPDTT